MLTFLYNFAIDEHLVAVVRLNDQSVDMSVHVILATDILGGQQVLSFVVENDVHFLGRRTANVRTEHDLVRRFTVQLLLVQRTVEQLQVSTATVDVLFVFHCDLEGERLQTISGQAAGKS